MAAAPPSSRPTPVAARIERRGIEIVPDDERRGTPRRLGLVWAGIVLNVQCVVFGALLVAIGLTWWQALLAVALGNLTWLVAGVTSLAGPAAGTSTFAVNRAPFGRDGNRPLAVLNWLMQLGYEVLDLVLMVFATLALLRLAGVEPGTGGTVAVVVVLSAVQMVLPVVGYATMTRALRLLAIPFAVLFAVLGVLTLAAVEAPPAEPAGLATFLGGVAIAASSAGLGWSVNAADYSRYLPRTVSRRGVVVAVALGGGVPQALLMAIGVGVALLTPGATDPLSGVPSVFPLWFVVPYLVLVVVQMLALNAVCLYSSALALQGLGLPIGRWQAVVLDGVIGAAVGLAVVLAPEGFTAVVSGFLLLMIVWFAPWIGIFVVDLALRRGRYDPDVLMARAGPRVHPPGLVAQAAGMVAAWLWLSSPLAVGPLAAATGGLDLSAPAGVVVGSGVYWALARRTVR